MCKIKCVNKTCKNYEEGICKAETIEIKDFEYWDEEQKTYEDKAVCSSYEYSSDWMY